ncbi:MAG TPA: hypothetical protein VE778_02890 [Candidatus Bathyarchaeia archaeon]|nr:hypothetical protein [Candidatus Bathyarchaeia archaeon]
MNLTLNLWSAGAACLMSALTYFAPFANSGAKPMTAGVKPMSPQAGFADTISGTLVDHSTNLPVSGAIVALEQLEINGVLVPASQPVTGAIVALQQLGVVVPGQPGTTMIDRVVATTTSGPDGSFMFTGLQPGSFFDVVAGASVTLPSGVTQTYAMTVTTTVPVGSDLGQIPLVPEFGDSAYSGSPAETSARVTTSTSSGTATTADIKLSALQGFMVQFTIPPFAGSTPQVTTAPAVNCPSGTACANYTLLTPASSFVLGTFNPGGTNYTIPTLTGPQEVIINIEGRAFLPGTTVPDCNPSRQTAGPVVLQGTIATKIPNLDFTGCQ